MGVARAHSSHRDKGAVMMRRLLELDSEIEIGVDPSRPDEILSEPIEDESDKD